LRLGVLGYRLPPSVEALSLHVLLGRLTLQPLDAADEHARTRDCELVHYPLQCAANTIALLQRAGSDFFCEQYEQLADELGSWDISECEMARHQRIASHVCHLLRDHRQVRSGYRDSRFRN